MSGDFARVSFDPLRHYTRVLLQQGRVLLEADFNEQSAIHHHYLRTLVVDLAGRAWRAGQQAFDLTAPGGAGGNGLPSFGIGAGRFYLEGLPCHNPADCEYAHQPFGPLPDGELEAAPTANDSVLVYLEAWERQVGPSQHPWLREPALGGADSAIRSQIVWQVRATTSARARRRLQAVHDALALRGEDTDPTDTAGEDLTSTLAAAIPVAKDVARAGSAFLDALRLAPPRLAALGHDETPDKGSYAMAPSAAYSGRENQLYCVVVHRGGVAGGQQGATFKWSRENGSAVLRIAPKGVVQDADTLVVTVESLGHDRRSGLRVNDWVEIDGDAFEFAEAAPPLGKVRRIDVGRRQVTLELSPGGARPSYVGCTVLRRWDQPADSDAAGVPVVESAIDDQWTALERGVRVRFLPGGVYRSGDYWLIPARVASGDIEWPVGDDGRPLASTPHGPQRVAAPLGFGYSNGSWTFTNCGHFLEPLAR